MKKFKILLLTILVFQFIGLTSCSDWLNLTPEDQVPKGRYWKTKEDVSSAMTGVYSSALSTVYYMFIWGESRADMWKYGRYTLLSLKLINDGEISESNDFCNWRTFYSTINNCNILLKYAPDVLSKDNSFTEAALKEYEAQAIAMRSLMYFYLVRTFGDVPFSLDAYSDDSKKLALAKTGQSIILDSLVIQLERLRSSNSIPYKYNSNAANKGKMTRYAVDALLADIYLWQENYTKCVEMCDEILNSGQYALIPVNREEEKTDDGETVYHATPADVSALFSRLYVEGNSVESIFELQFAKDVTNPFYYLLSPRANCYMLPNTEYINNEIFPNTQTGDREYEDIRKQINTKGNYVWKHVGITFESNESFSPQDMTNNWIVYRLADIYLMKAEALTQIASQTGNNQATLQEALDLVNTIRVRANAVETTEMTLTATGTIDMRLMEKYVMDERGRELMFEGKRWFDVLRNAKRNKYANLNYLLGIVPANAPADKVFSIQTKLRNVNSHYMPILSRELEMNSLLIQNPFYAK